MPYTLWQSTQKSIDNSTSGLTKGFVLDATSPWQEEHGMPPMVVWMRWVKKTCAGIEWTFIHGIAFPSFAYTLIFSSSGLFVCGSSWHVRQVVMSGMVARIDV
jgi:hypothetical protein